MAVAGAALAASACQQATGTLAGHHSTGRAPAPAPAAPGPVAASGCHSGGTATEPTADPHCTPGATNPQVTPATLGQTICKKGWTKTIRPPASYTNRLKTEQMRAYGYPDTNPRDYEEDHLISLELGGAPADPRNLWPEPGASPNRKDKVENAAHAAVCAHRLPLEEAQRRIATDWVGLGHQLGAV